ncbi:hypothetical protein OROHE_017221 [Orobanche hederae]
MPSGLLSKFHVAFGCGFQFQRAVRVEKTQPIRLIRNSSTCRLLRYSSNTYTMAAASGSVLANSSGFVKPGGVFFCDRGYKICRLARVSIRSGDIKCNNISSRLVFQKGLREARNSSRSCCSGGIVPELSTGDGSLSAQQPYSLAISVEEQSPSHSSSLKLRCGACYMPHPDKEETGGEDAHFICADEQVIGVADGVGGWADVGVNAGDYARQLMSNSVKAIRQVPSDGDVDPLHVLKKAHAETSARGSSTACIIALKNQDLHAINLGDSGFMVVRDECVIFESPVQQHGFNFPYQLQHGSRCDLPSSGQVFKISVVPGDVVVAGSDGLFDNLYNKEIAAIVADAVKEDLSPDGTAQKIADVARVRALDGKHRSPFSTAAQQAGFYHYGGKLDDLTVVVCYVSA